MDNLVRLRIRPSLLARIDRDVKRSKGEESRSSVIRKAVDFYFAHRECTAAPKTA